MLFMGTGAAEMYPNPYCDCDVCQRARKSGAVPRKRSAFMLNEKAMIDFGPDVLAASQMYDAPLSLLQDVFITHTHEDHLCIPNVEALTMADFRKGHFPIRFYISEKGLHWLHKYIEAVKPLGLDGLSKLRDTGRLQLLPVVPYTWFKAADMNIFAIETNHNGHMGEKAINYLFDRGKEGKLLYACDTGLYSEHNLEALQNQKADILIMEGTLGSKDTGRDGGHMNADHFLEQVDNLLRVGALKPDAQVYVTHINQVQTFSHEEYQRYMTLNSQALITVAFDGMRI